jgi:hypothetical protein
VWDVSSLMDGVYKKHHQTTVILAPLAWVEALSHYSIVFRVSSALQRIIKVRRCFYLTLDLIVIYAVLYFQGRERKRNVCKPHASRISMSRTRSCQYRYTSLTLRHRFTLLIVCSIRIFSRAIWVFGDDGTDERKLPDLMALDGVGSKVERKVDVTA